MKYLILLTAFALCAFGWVDEDGRDSSIPSSPSPYTNDAISLNYVGSFQVSTAYHILGLAHCTSGPAIGLKDSVRDSLRWVDYSGTQTHAIGGYGSSGFGICHTWPVPYGWFSNSWISSDMYYYEDGAGWSTAWANPAGTYGRGMEYNTVTNYFWQTSSSTGVYWMDEAGANTYFALSEPGSQMSGITVFPYNGNLGIIITTYDYQDWHFYEFEPGGGFTYLGSANPGISSFDGSYGITYNPDNDTFFWSYKLSGDIFWIGEYSVSGLALEKDTWGGIKSEF